MKNYPMNISLRELFSQFLLVGFALLLFSGNLFAGSANLAWNASTSSNVGGYKVSYGQSSGSYSSTVDASNTTTYTVPNLQEGTKYYFAVKAYDSTKTVESAYSNEASFTVPVTTTSTTPTTTSTTPTTTSTTPTTTSTSSNGLVAAYGFEETSGTTVTDASGNGNNGTINGAASVSTGHSGKALQFNGSSNWVTVNDSASLDLSTGMTLEAWVYPLSQSNGGNTVILKEASNAEVYALYSEEDVNLPISYINNGNYSGVSGPSRLPANAWTHLVATYDGSYQRLYVNGVQVGQVAQSGQIQQSSGVLRIGGNSLWNEYFDGYIDEVRIYNRALTATEVSNNMKTPVSAASTPLQFIMGDMNMEPWIAYQPMGRAQAYQVTATKSASITEVQAYLDASATTAKKVVAGVYTDSNGHAKTLISQGTLSTLKPGAWNAISIPAAAVTSGQKYWIAILGADGQIGFLDRVGSGVGLMEKSSSSTLTSLPTSWTASSYGYLTNASMSIYGNGL